MNNEQELATLDNVLSEPTGDENVEIGGILHKCVAYEIEQRREEQ